MHTYEFSFCTVFQAKGFHDHARPSTKSTGIALKRKMNAKRERQQQQQQQHVLNGHDEKKVNNARQSKVRKQSYAQLKNNNLKPLQEQKELKMKEKLVENERKIN